MRVSAQLITKVVSEAVSKNHLAGTVSGAGKDAIRGTRPSRAAGGAPRSNKRASGTASQLGGMQAGSKWTRADDARVRSIARKVSRNVAESISSMLEDSWHSMSLLTKQELSTAIKMGFDELRDVIAKSPAIYKAIDDVTSWILASVDYVDAD